MEKQAAIHEICAVACEALDALRYRLHQGDTVQDPHDLEELKTRFNLALEELGPSWWINFAEME